MHIIPGKYCFSEDGSLVAPDKFVLPLWDYIDINLKALKINDEYLLSLFDITKTALNSWKNGTREISLDKLVVLCNLFGVTIDQMLDRDFNDNLINEDFMGLSQYKNINNLRGISSSSLSYIINQLTEAECSIEYYALGYIPMDESPDDPEGMPNEYYISDDSMDYFCQCFDFEVKYELRSGEVVIVKSAKLRDLQIMRKVMDKEWGSDSYKHIYATDNNNYMRVILLSENALFLDEYLKGHPDKANQFLSLWVDLHNENKNFDTNNLIIKVILANGGLVLFNNVPDYESTMSLYKMIASKDVDCIKEERK